MNMESLLAEEEGRLLKALLRRAFDRWYIQAHTPGSRYFLILPYLNNQFYERLPVRMLARDNIEPLNMFTAVTRD